MRRLNPFDAKRKELEQQLQAQRHEERQKKLKEKRQKNKIGQAFIKDFLKNVQESQKRDEDIWYAEDSAEEEAKKADADEDEDEDDAEEGEEDNE